MPYIRSHGNARVIAANEAVEFHFWGPRTKGESNVGADSSDENQEVHYGPGRFSQCRISWSSAAVQACSRAPRNGSTMDVLRHTS